MQDKPYYPIFIDISQLDCLIVGGGGVGCRKLTTLLDHGVRHVLVLDMAAPSPELCAQLQRGSASFEQREYRIADLQGKALVFAATGNSAVNARIAEHCHVRGIFCNCVDAPRAGNFIVPALARVNGISAALSSNGASPALTRQWKKDLQDWLSPRAVMAEFMGRLRPLVLALPQSTRQNTQLFRTIVHSPLQEYLHMGKRTACEHILTELLPPTLWKHIPELLHELV